MRFHEKLDFLMNITATTNVMISHKIDVDPSYISRLRRGERKPIQDRAVIEIMSSYFVRNAHLDYQVEVLSNMVYLDYKNRDELGRIVLLSDWLCDKGVVIKEEFGILDEGQRMQHANEDVATQCSSGIYFGPEGKRQAVLKSLATVMKSKETNPILFFDDGDSAWLLEDKIYRDKMKKGLKAIVEKGHRIIVVHNITRSLNDTLRSIEFWIPIHFTGMVESYYYPNIRDNLFKRTLFVVPETVAVVSNTVEEENEGTANFFIMEPTSLKTFEDEFNQLLDRCLTLLEVYQAKERRKFFDLMVTYDRIRGDTIYNLENLSLMTMPEEVRKQIMSRLGNNNGTFDKVHQKRKSLFREKIMEEKYYEVIHKKNPKDILNGMVKFSHSGFSHGYPIYYSKDEYVAHLENFIALAEEYENFHFVLEEEKEIPDLPLYLKERGGAVLVSPGDGETLIHTNEATSTAAFYDYLRYATALGNYDDEDKGLQTEKLKAYIGEIKNM